MPGRRLTEAQERAVLESFAINGRPLWLKLASEQARHWASWQNAPELPPRIEDLIRDFIGIRLLGRGKHPKAFASRALVYLTLGRMGLTESELDHALATDDEVKREFDAHAEKTGQTWEERPRGSKLPPILWSRLYFDLRSFLSEREAGGSYLLRWFHREFASGVNQYLGLTDDGISIARRHLAETMAALAPIEPVGVQSTASHLRPVQLRRIMEEGWQYFKVEDKAKGEAASRAALQMLENPSSSWEFDLLVTHLNALTSLLLRRPGTENLQEALRLQILTISILKKRGVQFDRLTSNVMLYSGRLCERLDKYLQKNSSLAGRKPLAAETSSIDYPAKIKSMREKAEWLYQNAVKIRTRLLGPNHKSTRDAQGRLDGLRTRLQNDVSVLQYVPSSRDP